jgi:hypothetical protein
VIAMNSGARWRVTVSKAPSRRTTTLERPEDSSSALKGVLGGINATTVNVTRLTRRA